MKTTHELYKYALALLLAVMGGVSAWGQVTGNRYRDKYGWNFNTSNQTIRHKPAKWYDLRESLGLSEAAKDMDTFNDEEPMFEMSNAFAGILSQKDIQAAHTSVDTIYMRRGTSITLVLPDRQTSSGLTSMRTYQRWYSFRTGKTFRTQKTGNNVVYDLLTPTWGQLTPYRFENGYVGRPMTNTDYTDDEGVVYSMDFYYPTEKEFESWFSETDRAGIDDDWFVVACDVSGYTDFTEDFTDNSSSSTFAPNYIEPTLTHRFIFYICAVDNPNSWYKKALDAQGQNSDTSYLEEYEINMPAVRIPNETLETIALTKDAQSYGTPENDDSPLTVSLGDNSAGITLQTTSLSGTNRVIQFDYPSNGTSLWGDGTESVPDGSSATILVTKGNYRIAKYKLNFKAENSLMTQTMVDQIGTTGTEAWRQYTFRKPENLNRSYQLLSELNFDYDAGVAELYDGQEQVYPFPLEWNSSSYGFYDGSSTNDYKSQYRFPQWGHYAIVNDFLERGDWAWGGRGATTSNDYKPLSNSDNAPSTYHIFVDASDRPGVIARLPFEAELCAGSELFVSAWVKCARWEENNNGNAAMLFTIMGVTSGGEYVPIYRQQTGQIPTTYINDAGVTLPGFSERHSHNSNEWLQVYFSFINDEAQDFESYVLQVENNSASTDGGDMYLDDIRVYMTTVNAEVEQLSPSCIGDYTSLRMILDWERLLSRMGITEGEDTGTRSLRFCFVDKAGYDAAIAANPSDPVGAINSNQVGFVWGEEETNEQTEGTLSYDLKYMSNAPYNTSNLGENTGKLYRFDNEGARSLAVDLWAADLIPTRRYYLAIAIGEGNFEIASETNPCAISTDFSVTASTLIKMNGQVLTSETEYCIGQVFNFTAQLTINDGTPEGEPVTTPVYFDWFFGTVDEYLSTNNQYNVSLDAALEALRDIDEYRDLERITDDVTPKEELTQEMINLLKQLSTEAGTTGGQNSPLVLHKQNLNVTLLEGGLRMVIRPIQTTVTDINGAEVPLTQICWNYVPIELTTNSEAPEVHTGFWYMQYPNGYESALRIGQKQLYSDKDLLIDLRVMNYVNDNANGLEIINPNESQGQVSGADLRHIYLVASNDPAMNKYINVSGFTEYDLPIGELSSLETVSGSSGNRVLATIRFDFGKETETDAGTFKFQPREGYEYTFNVWARESLSGSQTSSACYTHVPVTIKVVPEYLTWTGETTDNWNNDSHWLRSDRDELKKGTDYDENETLGYEDAQVHGGYVPMLFSKVLVPSDKKIELYQAGYNTTNGWIINRPSHIGEPTSNIQYDLMVFDHTQDTETGYAGRMKTERYRVSLCDEIHFEPGAEMLHAEYLLYNKAWVDYKLTGGGTNGRWYTLASPLENVVAGDFYTDRSGTENSAYFEDIKYDGTVITGNSRFNPSVYQRSWKGNTSVINLYTSGTTTENVAISGNWSSLYNDVEEKYDPGTGFSLKVQDLPDGTSDAVFRLPKSDNNYTYYYSNGGSGTTSDVIARTNIGRLKTDDIYKREQNETAYSGSIETKNITVPFANIATSDNVYYLIGNPFMAHLDMEEFFETNQSFAEMYWLITKGGQNVAVGSDNGWITNENGSLPAVAPLQSFFVKLKDEQSALENITFTQDMQVLGDANDGLRSSTDVLYLSATSSDGRTSRAAVAYDGAASAEYVSGEDAELFLDSNLGDVPMVYTVAGTMATSINRTSQLADIPVGLYGTQGETVTLAFEGLDSFSGATLYDAQEGTETLLYDGRTVTVPARTSGRYFLRLGAATDNKTISARKTILIYTVGRNRVVVSSDGEPLQTIRVYNMAGSLVRQERVSGTQYEFTLPAGIYIVSAEDRNGMLENVKVRVR